MDSYYRNVKDFGAVGDGIANDTAAIQRALDAGGVVYVPGGTYRTGTLYLRSNGGLELAPDAMLVGSPDPADYNAWDFCPQNWKSIAEKAGGAHLIVALEVENVFLGGHGRIWGNREAFFDTAVTPSRNDFTGWRPSQMLFFCESKNISVSDLTLLNSPYWCLFLYGCDNARIKGLNISNTPRTSWNGDGIDIDCCRNVTVSDCIVRAADDCVTIRAAGANRLVHHDNVCENIAISNCVMLDGHCGVRYGVGTGLIRNCSASNLVMKDTLFGIGVHQSYETKIFPTAAAGCQVEGLTFDNMSIDSRMPLYITATTPPNVIQHESQHQIHGLSYNNIRARGYWSVEMVANEDMNIYDVQMSNCSFQMHDGDEEVYALPKEKRTSWGQYFEYGMYMENIRDFQFHNVRLTWENERPEWKSALCMKNTHELTFRDCRFDAPRNGLDVIRQ